MLQFYRMFNTRWHINPQTSIKEKEKLDNKKHELLTFFVWTPESAMILTNEQMQPCLLLIYFWHPPLMEEEPFQKPYPIVVKWYRSHSSGADSDDSSGTSAK